jgi:hypothetical protein
MKAKEFDKHFDSGHDITTHLDLTKASRPWAGTTSSKRGLPLLDDRFVR